MSKKDKEIQFDLEGSIDQGQDLTGKINALEKEVSELKEFIYRQGLAKEYDEFFLKDEEFICINGMASIRKLVELNTYQKDDINNFKVLYEVYRQISGTEVPKNKKEKPLNKEELLKLVKSGK